MFDTSGKTICPLKAINSSDQKQKYCFFLCNSVKKPYKNFTMKKGKINKYLKKE
jgi:hypothetical protein